MVPFRVFHDQKVAHAHGEHHRGHGKNVFRRRGLKIENDDFSGNGHQGRCHDDLDMNDIFTQIDGDVDKNFDGDENGHEGTERCKNIIDGQHQKRWLDQLLIEHPADIDDTPQDDGGHQDRQQSHGETDDFFEPADQGIGYLFAFIHGRFNRIGGSPRSNTVERTFIDCIIGKAFTGVNENVKT